jgi:tetratricopeptide (TPR) repeat protein
MDVSNLTDAKAKLGIIASEFSGNAPSRTKRQLLALALTDLGKIFQLWGQVHLSIPELVKAARLWLDLRDKPMAAYALHMAALSYNVGGAFKVAVALLGALRDCYKGRGERFKNLRGDLERDLCAVYLNLGETQLAELQIKKSLILLSDVEHRDSYFAALHKLGQVQTKLGQYESAYDSLLSSIQASPPRLALRHVQINIALADLCFSLMETEEGLKHVEIAERRAKECGFEHQLLHLRRVQARHRLIATN